MAVELVGNDPREDRADRAPRDPQQPLNLRLAHLLRQPRGEIFEVARVARARPGPPHPLVHIPAARAVQASEPALDHAAQGAEIQRPPALVAMLLDLQPARATARADRLPRAQHDGHDHRLLPERHIPDPCTRKPKHPVQCGRDPHVALLRRPLNFEHPAACRIQGDGGSLHTRATCETFTPGHAQPGVAEPRAARQAAPPDHQPPRPTPDACRRTSRLTRTSAPLSSNDRRQSPAPIRSTPRPRSHPHTSRSPD